MPKRHLGFSRGRKTVVKMIGADVQMQLYSTDEMLDYLQNIGLRARDMQTPLQRFGEYLVNEQIPQQFEKQGIPKRWSPLSPAYAAWKRRHFGKLPILVLSGAMRAGFSYKVTPRTLQIRNRKKYWQFHQTGTAKMPARPPLQITNADREKLRELAREWMTFETGGGVL